MLGYTEAIDVHKTGRLRPIDSPSLAWKGRYRNCDPWVIGSLIKDAVLRRGEEYLSFPQLELCDRISIRRQVIETDPFGNFIFTGCVYGTPRNWARLGCGPDGSHPEMTVIPELATAPMPTSDSDIGPGPSTHRMLEKLIAALPRQ